MKFRIVEWQTGLGEKYFTLQVKKKFFWYYISSYGIEFSYSITKYITRDEALESIDIYVRIVKRNKVKKINTEYIIKDI